ncbi:MAG: methylated-DNA--[protein]-cysteine S-methyltransferase [Ignavibacteriales bacterium]|nr:MAG: methylated-DNA--[protein]-cysteine S-methyltransferase [Ignavibacteriales bacterium]
MIYTAAFESGGISFLVKADEKGILSLHFHPDKRALKAEELKPVTHKAFFGIKKQLDEYFAGRRISFDLPLNFQTEGFRGEVYKVMKKIPHGKTLSYKDIAEKIKRPLASRAVGNACGANTIPIIIPCHRVLAAGGRLGGYSGGLDIKKKLLALEGIPFKG